MARKSYFQILADNIATRWLRAPRQVNPPELRDYVDIAAGSDLDCIALDILTDMVESRLAKAQDRERLLAAARRPHGH